MFVYAPLEWRPLGVATPCSGGPSPFLSFRLRFQTFHNIVYFICPYTPYRRVPLQKSPGYCLHLNDEVVRGVLNVPLGLKQTLSLSHPLSVCLSLSHPLSLCISPSFALSLCVALTLCLFLALPYTHTHARAHTHTRTCVYRPKFNCV